jgi:hypothetical protein
MKIKIYENLTAFQENPYSPPHIVHVDHHQEHQDYLYHAHNHPRYHQSSHPQIHDPNPFHYIDQHDHYGHNHHHSNPPHHQLYGSHIESSPHSHSPHHSHIFDPHFLHNNDASHLHSLPTHVISHVPNHPPEVHHQIPLTSPDPFLIEANEALAHVVSLNHPKNPHENHDQISSILDKLRTTNTTQSDENSKLMFHRKVGKRSIFNWRSTTTQKPADIDDAYHPTVISNEDKFIAGCLMQCVFRRNNAVDKMGYPTLDGIVDLYTAGVSEQPFFIHVMRSVDKCLKSASVKYKILKGQSPQKGETCDVAFDVFDCVSDSITDYCSG